MRENLKSGSVRGLIVASELILHQEVGYELYSTKEIGIRKPFFEKKALPKKLLLGNIKGFVENLKPYDVRIVCEGEQGDIKRFIGALKIEEDPLISISDVAAEYAKTTGEFEYFEIKRGSSEEETAERLDLAALHLKNLTSAVSIMDKDIGEERIQVK